MTQKLTALTNIFVPEVKPDEVYSLNYLGKDFSFTGLKALLAAADVSKAGDRNARLASTTETGREAARTLLSKLLVSYIYERPLTDHLGNVDSVMRINYDIDLAEYNLIKQLTIGELKDRLLKSTSKEASRIGFGMTGVLAAAVTKIMDVHEMIFVAQKIERLSTARTTLGVKGRLSSRLQPNHPTDDLRSITYLTYAGLSTGGGDALIGMNPAIDTIDNISSVLRHLDKIRRKTGAPTQICVLSHVKTQMACLALGVPVEIMFQSLAGTEQTNLTEFDFTVDLLDEAYRTMRDQGPLARVAKQFMYFETGQGSEFTYNKHNGIDMATCEALCYGLARRYDPFMVNNVTGFIGPETHLDNFEMILSNLQDHFMGKLLGLPMGMAPCYTLHSNIGLDGQQMATQMLTAAGANFYMEVCLNTDRMLAYFDTSGHDNQTLREIYGKKPSEEYLQWAITKNIFALDSEGSVIRGKNWGQPRMFCESDLEYNELLLATPSIPGFSADDHAGPRPTNRVARELRLDQAIGRAAIQCELDIPRINACTPFRVLHTNACDKQSHLTSPELGAFLNELSSSKLAPENSDVQIIVADGLSAEAVHANIPEMIPILLDGFSAKKMVTGQPIALAYGRVKVGEHVAGLLNCKIVVLLIGERPGGSAIASRSLSAYLLFRISDPWTQSLAAAFSKNPDIRFEYTVISNIYEAGLPPAEAACFIVEKCEQILSQKAAGNRLESLGKGLPGAQ
jgi:ethanolamine ammonia-lyase large subunit